MPSASDSEARPEAWSETSPEARQQVRSEAQLPALTARIREILRSPGFGRESRAVPTGWTAVDRALGGGLVRGAVHEWFGVGEDAPHPRRGGGPWTPPLYLAIARQFVKQSNRPVYFATSIPKFIRKEMGDSLYLVGMAFK